MRISFTEMVELLRKDKTLCARRPSFKQTVVVIMINGKLTLHSPMFKSDIAYSGNSGNDWSVSNKDSYYTMLRETYTKNVILRYKSNGYNEARYERGYGDENGDFDSVFAYASFF